MDDRADPGAASAASAGSVAAQPVAAQPDTVVRKRVEPKPQSASKNGDTSDGEDKSSNLTAAEALGSSSTSAGTAEGPEKTRTASSSGANPAPATAPRTAASRTTSSKPSSSGSNGNGAGKSSPPADVDAKQVSAAPEDAAPAKPAAGRSKESAVTLPRPLMSPAVTSAAADKTVVAATPGQADSEPKTDKPAAPDGSGDATAPWPSSPRSKSTTADSPDSASVSPKPAGTSDQDSDMSAAAALAAAALATDPPSSAYSPTGYPSSGYSDYTPASYSPKESSSRDSVWTTPSSSADTPSTSAPSTGSSALGSSRSASAGHPPAVDESSVGSRSSSIWTRQEPKPGKSAYSPSGTGLADKPLGAAAGAAGSASAAGSTTTAGAGAASSAGYGSTAQMPGPMVASGSQLANAAPSVAPLRPDEKSKPRSPSGTPTKTKRRKASQAARQAALTVGTAAAAAAAVTTRPSPTRRPTAPPSVQNARLAGADARRDAQLVIARVEPWSVMKFSFIVSLVGWIVLFIAIALLYYALQAFGVFHYLEQTVVTVTTSKGHAGSNASSWFSASTVLGYTMLVGAINVVLFTALATVGAVVYNLITHLSGGVEVTLREAD